MAWRVNEVEADSEVAVVELEGIVDSTNLEDFFAFINSVFKQGFKRIVLDMEFTSYLSSGGLSVVIDALKRAEREGGTLVVARASDMIKDLFEIVQVDRILDFYEDLDEAIASV